MTKRFLNQLVLASYTKDILDEKKVQAIAKKLSRRDLKSYIRVLKLSEKKRKVFVALPKAKLYNKAEFKKIFPDKQLLLEEDLSLLLGMRIVDNDMVYDISLRDRLREILEKIEENYN